MKQRFGIAKDSMTPSELIQCLLQAEVELLWFGGIGTYVKASAESHLDVGDRATDALRVDGEQLRAKVTGEGANLGMTQLGCIEYCEAGGRCNPDFIHTSHRVYRSHHTH